MTKQYDTQEQIDAFNIYVKQNPDGRQVHHTGTLGYDDDEWKAFQEGWNAALAQPDQESLDLFEYWNAVEGWVKIDEVRNHFGSVGCGTIYKTAGEDRVPVYTAPPKRQWVGLTDEDISEIEDEYIVDYRIPAGSAWNFARAVETKLKAVNGFLKEKNT